MILTRYRSKISSRGRGILLRPLLTFAGEPRPPNCRAASLTREIYTLLRFPEGSARSHYCSGGAAESAYQIIRALLCPKQRLFNPILRFTFVAHRRRRGPARRRNNRRCTARWLINFGSRRIEHDGLRSSVSNDACSILRYHVPRSRPSV